MIGALLLLPHTNAWSGLRKLYLFTFKFLSTSLNIFTAIFENESLAWFTKYVSVFSPQRSPTGPTDV